MLREINIRMFAAIHKEWVDKVFGKGMRRKRFYNSKRTTAHLRGKILINLQVHTKNSINNSCYITYIALH